MKKHTISFSIFTILCVFLSFSQTNYAYASQTEHYVTHNTQLITPSKIWYLISAEGKRGTVQYIGQTHQWNTIFTSIQRGNPQWINLVPALISTTSPQIRKHFYSSLTKAILVNPQAVLNILPIGNEDLLGRHRICAAKNFSSQRKKSLIASIKAIHTIRLVYQRDDCLTDLNKEES